MHQAIDTFLECTSHPDSKCCARADHVCCIIHAQIGTLVGSDTIEAGSDAEVDFFKFQYYGYVVDELRLYVTARDLLRSLIERLVVRPLPDGGFELEIVGALASMVRLGQSTATNSKAALGGGFVALDERSVKVVAGARSRLYRTERTIDATGWQPSTRAKRRHATLPKTSQ
jgi:hypothetical protein